MPPATHRVIGLPPLPTLADRPAPLDFSDFASTSDVGRDLRDSLAWVRHASHLVTDLAAQGMITRVQPCVPCQGFANVSAKRFARWLFTAAGAQVQRDKFGSWVVQATGDQYATVGAWIDDLKRLREAP